MAEAGTHVDRPGLGELIKVAYDSIKRREIGRATDALHEALRIDFDNREVMYALKCAGFWEDREKRSKDMLNHYERGEYLLSQWKAFLGFRRRLEGVFDDADYAFKRYLFSMALSAYDELALERHDAHAAELAFRRGQCLKGLGDLEASIACLEDSLKERKEDAWALAELGDAYALVDQTRTAKILFREAFFIQAQAVELESLESALIVRLIERVESLGYSGADLAEWIPVYGALYGVFNVKRELRPIEVGKLKQGIYQLENEVRETQEGRSRMVARLIHRYFWLMDYYIASREDRTKINEVLLKLKILDPAVYALYVA